MFFSQAHFAFLCKIVDAFHQPVRNRADMLMVFTITFKPHRIPNRHHVGTAQVPPGSGLLAADAGGDPGAALTQQGNADRDDGYTRSQRQAGSP